MRRFSWPSRRRSWSRAWPASSSSATIIRFLYGRPLETLLATFGVSLVLQQLVRSVFSANNRAVSTPAWMSGTWQVNEALAITYNRIYIVGFTLVVFALLLLVLQRTRLGPPTSGRCRRTARWRGPWASAAAGSTR